MLGKLIAAFFATMFFPACSMFGSFNRIPFDPVYQIPAAQKAPDPQVAFFNYEKTPITWDKKMVSDCNQARYLESVISFPSAGSNRQKNNRVYLRYLESKSMGKKKLVVVLRIPGGPATDGFPSSIMAAHLIGWGHLANPWFSDYGKTEDTNVIIVESVSDIVDWEKLKRVQTEAELLQTADEAIGVIRTHIIDIRRVLDLASTWGEVDMKRVGIVGFSTSATEAIIAMSIDKRFSAGVFVGAVARFHELMGHGTKEVTQLVQDTARNNLGFTKEQLTKKLGAISARIDPILYAPMIDLGRTLMFDARFDEYMSADTREALAEALGRPERITYNLGHTRSIAVGSSVLGGGKIGRMAARFFNEKL